MKRHSALTTSGILAAAILTGSHTIVAQPGPSDSAKPQPGQNAPTFTLPSQSGTPVSLASLRGRWVVLYFYPEDFTAGCTIEAHNFQRDADMYAKLNALIVGVSVDSVDSHKQFCAKEGLNIKLLSDMKGSTVARYGSLDSTSHVAKRNTFLIDPSGKITQEWIGVSPREHSAQVLAAIRSAE